MDELGRMFGVHGAGPRLSWLWIIEYVSSFPQIDTSIIRDLIEAAPVSPNNLGKSTSEMVALRYLEELFGPKNGLANVSPPDSRVTFDLSLSCKDVLQHILQEVSISDLKNAGPELLRWDVYPFIMHKRASLPKCALEQLKDSILEEIPVLDGDKNVPKSRFDDSDDENGNQDGILIPQIHKNDNEMLQDGLLERNLMPSKRSRDDLVVGNPVGLVSVNRDSIDNHLHLNPKKFQHDAFPACTIQSVEHIPIRLQGEEQLEDESGMIIKVTEIEGNNLGKDSQVGEGDQGVRVASRNLGPSDAVGHVELQDSQMENVQNADADVMIEQQYGGRPCQNVVMDESNYVENGALQKGPNGDSGENIGQGFPLSSPNSTSADRLQQDIDPDEAKADMEHPCAEQTCKYEDERFNIALKKSIFLSSKCTSSQDPVRKAGWTEQNLCGKCNQNGQVLVCSSSGCPLVVHESCLGSAARFDDKGNFYCPFCAYSVSISKYLEAKEKTSLARKNLALFMELFSKKLTKEQRKLQSHLRVNGDEDLVGNKGSGHLGEREQGLISQNREVNHGPSASHLDGNKLRVEGETIMGGAVVIEGENNEEEEKVGHGHRSMREHEHQHEELSAPSASCLDGNKLRVEEETIMVGAVDIEGENNEEEEKVGHGHRSMREHEHQQEELSANLKSSDDNPTSENPATYPANQVEVEGDILKEAVEAHMTDPPQKPDRALNSDGEESSTDANDKFIISNYSISFRNRETKYSFPITPQLRRKKVPWTNDEEEMLRKGVEKFADNGGTVPWKRILEYGTKVFMRGRTTVDLKDKWRNMSKGSLRCNK
ncbi:hypothetical protein REPUB_Repub02eG0184200 [Reevesia pubescens]